MDHMESYTGAIRENQKYHYSFSGSISSSKIETTAHCSHFIFPYKGRSCSSSEWIIVTCIFYVQVLSKSVAEALAYFGDPKIEETERFVCYFDNCLNILSGRLLVSQTENLTPLQMTVDWRYNNTKRSGS